MKIGNREFDTKHHTYVMGILNVTPDSFSDGGNYDQIDAALFHVEQMKKDGADLIDVGGESTRPGHTQISDQEEISRVVPVIERIKKETDLPISVDTHKSEVAKAAIDAGADLINDIWGLKYDPNLAKVIAETEVACCLMHNRTLPEGTEETGTDAGKLMQEVMADLRETLRLAKEAGIRDEKIMLDPGVGFGKTCEMNLQVMHELAQFQTFGYPVLLGTSRKSMIGLTLNVPVDQREEGTLVTTVMAVQTGCGFVRVHDVLKNKRAIQMTEAIRDAV